MAEKEALPLRVDLWPLGFCLMVAGAVPSRSLSTYPPKKTELNFCVFKKPAVQICNFLKKCWVAVETKEGVAHALYDDEQMRHFFSRVLIWLLSIVRFSQLPIGPPPLWLGRKHVNHAKHGFRWMFRRWRRFGFVIVFLPKSTFGRKKFDFFACKNICIQLGVQMLLSFINFI